MPHRFAGQPAQSGPQLGTVDPTVNSLLHGGDRRATVFVQTVPRRISLSLDAPSLTNGTG